MAFLMLGNREKRQESLSEKVFDHFGVVHTGEALVEAKVAVGESLVIDAKSP